MTGVSGDGQWEQKIVGGAKAVGVDVFMAAIDPGS